MKPLPLSLLALTWKAFSSICMTYVIASVAGHSPLVPDLLTLSCGPRHCMMLPLRSLTILDANVLDESLTVRVQQLMCLVRSSSAT